MRDAERAGIIRTIGSWALRETLGTWHKLNDKGISLRMAVNVSFPEVADPDYADKVLALLEEFQVPASCLELELTETAMMLDASVSLRNLRLLKQAGIHIVLDDFGTGLSSFGYLKHFPVDFLKIDGSFVKEILHDPIDREMVRSINEIGHLTGKQTIAEFAENEEIITMLRGLGLDYSAGYGRSGETRVTPAVA